MTPKTYKVTRAGTFDVDVTRLSEKVWRLDEFIKGIKDTLTRNPEWGKSTKHKYMRALKMKELAGNPSPTVYYFYTRAEVVLLYLRLEGEALPPPMIL